MTASCVSGSGNRPERDRDTTTSLTPKELLIVPGKSIGPLRLGMTRDEAQKAMTSALQEEDRETIPGIGEDEICWLLILCAKFSGDGGRINRIFVFATPDAPGRDVLYVFQTSESIKVNAPGISAVNQLTKTLGAPQLEEQEVENVDEAELVAAWPQLEIRMVRTKETAEFRVSEIAVKRADK